jgi:hypothetical protein
MTTNMCQRWVFPQSTDQPSSSRPLGPTRWSSSAHLYGWHLLPNTAIVAAQPWPCRHLQPSAHLPCPSAPPKQCHYPILSPSLPFPLTSNSRNRHTYGHQDPPPPATVGLPRPHASPTFDSIKRMPRPRMSSFVHMFLSSVLQPSCPWAPPTVASVHHRPVSTPWPTLSL